MSEATPRDARRRFTVIYDAYYHRVLGYVLRRVGRDDAADIVAETFTVAWRRLDRVPGGEEALYWLLATARRTTSNHLRAERRRHRLTEAIASEPSRANASIAEEASLERAALALHRIREDERELLLLMAWEGLDAAGVAMVVGCSRNAARIRIHRARRRFAAALADVDAVKQNHESGHSFAAATAERNPRLEEQE